MDRLIEAPDLRAADRLIKAVVAKLEANRETIAKSKRRCTVIFGLSKEGQIDVELLPRL